MQLSVSQLLTTDINKASKKQQEFSKLWKRIASLKKSNATFQQKLQILAEQVKPIIKAYEADSVVLLHQLIDRKTHFLGMKSLGKHNRDDLAQWIEESLKTIQTLQPEISDLLRQQIKHYNETLAKFYNMADEEADFSEDLDDELAQSPEQLLEQFAEQCRAQQQLERQQFIDNLNREQQHSLFDADDKITQFDNQQRRKFEQQMEDMVAEMADIASAFGEHYSEDDENQYDDSQYSGFEQHDTDTPRNSQGADKLRQLLESANISKMFRKIARALHPDREQDPEQQRLKQTLMAQAIQARDDGDVITIFDMYSTYVDNSQLYFDDEQLDSINILLKEQIKQLQNDKQEIIQATPQSYQCYEMFYASSAKKIQSKIKNFQQATKQELVALASLPSELKTLKHVKNAIQERNFSRFADPFDDLAAMFGI